MMNHYKKEKLTVKEAEKLRERAITITRDMAIPAYIRCIDTRKAWNEEIQQFEVVEQEIHVIGYFHKDEETMTEKLAEFLEMASSF